MIRSLALRAFSFAAGLTLAGAPALAGFDGQTILGPLVPGSVVNGDTTNGNDDNDGFSSGGHFFFIWNGPDDAWRLNWPGGDMLLTMTYNSPADDLDLFLYEPGSYDDSSNYSILSTGTETITAPAAAAGTYYIVVDSDTLAHAGPYTLSVAPIPEPAGIGAAAVAVLALARRRR